MVTSALPIGLGASFIPASRETQAPTGLPSKANQGGASHANDTASVEKKKSEQAITQVQQLLVQNRITGVDALRITGMITQAQNFMGSGDPSDAQRIAKQALKIAMKYDTGFPASKSKNQQNQDIKLPGSSGTAADSQNNTNSKTTSKDQPMGSEEKVLYKDSSNDGGISFQYATPVSNIAAPFAVVAHEEAHVRRETGDAILNSQHVMTSVQILQHFDPVTGEVRIDGGRTRVIIFPKYNPPQQLNTGHKANILA